MAAIATQIRFFGADRAGQSVNVFLHGTTTPAALFAADGVTPITNPMTVPAQGMLSFAAAPGSYDCVSTADGATNTITITAPQVTGSIIAGPVQLTNQFDIKAVGTVQTDVTGMSLAVPASTRPVILRFKGEIQMNTGTAAAGSALTVQVFITDNSNSVVAESAVTAEQVSTGTATVETGTALCEAILPAPVAGGTYKIRAKTTAAVPTNWTSALILPGNSTGTDNFYAVAG